MEEAARKAEVAAASASLKARGLNDARLKKISAEADARLLEEEQALEEIRKRQAEGKEKEKVYWAKIRAREAAAKAAAELEAKKIYDDNKIRLLSDCTAFVESIGKGDIKIDVPAFWKMVKDNEGIKKNYYLVHYIIILLDGVAQIKLPGSGLVIRENRFIIDIMPQYLDIKNGLNISIKVSDPTQIEQIKKYIHDSYWHDERDSEKYKVGDGNFYIDYPLDDFFSNIPQLSNYNLSNEEETYDTICSKNSSDMRLVYILRKLITDFFIRIIEHVYKYLEENNYPETISRSGDSVILTYKEGKKSNIEETVKTVINKNIKKLYDHISAIIIAPKIRRKILKSNEGYNNIQATAPALLLSDHEFKQHVLSKIRTHLGLPPEPIKASVEGLAQAAAAEAVQGPELSGRAAEPPPLKMKVEIRTLEKARNPWQPDPYRNSLIEKLAAAEANVKPSWLPTSWLPNRTKLVAAQNALSAYNALSSAEKAAAAAAAGKGGSRKSRTKRTRKAHSGKAVSGKAYSGKAYSDKTKRNKRSTRKN